MGVKILIINLDAMGDVLMTTAQLPALKRAHPESTIWWATLSSASPLLYNNPYVDKVLLYDAETLAILPHIHFDLVLNVDKSLRSGALALSVNATRRLGFGVNGNGKIIPLNNGAMYNYRLGLDDNLKFRVNTRTGQDYLAETFELDYCRDEYVFCFTDDERRFIDEYKREKGITENAKVIGFNTGCSTLFPNKKMTIAQHCNLIERFLSYGDRYTIVLLGGREDTGRNDEIASLFSGKVINTPTTMGVRRGACFEDVADVIITGDSFGMHLAIALKKYVIAWFGLSCWKEIDMYDRGVKLYPESLDCAPCWSRECPNNLECIDRIDLDRIEQETIRFFAGKPI